MTDRTDEDGPDDPADASSESDPFEYPAADDERTDADDGRTDVDGNSDTDDGRTDADARMAESDRSDSASTSASEEAIVEPTHPTGVTGWIRWFWSGDIGSWMYVRDVLTSLLIVLAIGALLFAASGVWPPMVAVESGSMEPNMERGDLIFIVDNERFVPEGAVDTDGGTTGIVPADVAERHDRTKFGNHGDVIVFMPNGNAGQTPIIHRAMFWVDEGENWYDRADPDAIGGADDCDALNHCPAPHAGFITKGDNGLTNRNYDQASQLSAPVRPGWVIGTAEIRVPYLGHVRLRFAGLYAQHVPVTTVQGMPVASENATNYSVTPTPIAGPIEPVRASSRPA